MYVVYIRAITNIEKGIRDKLNTLEWRKELQKTFRNFDYSKAPFYYSKAIGLEVCTK
jgi:hypothetical protein